MNINQRILHIKNMVCPRCKLVVKTIFKGLGYQVLAVELGQVVIGSQNSPSKKRIAERLKEHQFELLETKEEGLAERIKVLLISLLYWSRPARWPVALAAYLELSMQKKFEELDEIFFSSCGYTIQEYFNLLRFERAKELISYRERPVHHIAGRLGYNSTEALSLEFRQRLNLDISGFIRSAPAYRQPLDSLV
jgi:AraC-like DNA-binding protein